jgi:hypothetical protein
MQTVFCPAQTREWCLLNLTGLFFQSRPFRLKKNMVGQEGTRQKAKAVNTAIVS